VNSVTNPVRPRLDVNLRTFTNSGPSLTKNAAQAFFNKVNKFLPHFTEDELVKVERILDSIERRITPANKNIVNRNLRALRRGITIAKTGENQNNRGNPTTARQNNQRMPNRQNNQRTPNRQNNRGNPTSATPRPNNPNRQNNQRTPNRQNNRGNPTSATPRPNNPNRQNNQRTPNRQNNRGNPTSATPRPNNPNRSNLTRTTRSGTRFGKSQNLKTNSSNRSNGAK
jgi:hypothetical protein